MVDHYLVPGVVAEQQPCNAMLQTIFDVAWLVVDDYLNPQVAADIALGSARPVFIGPPQAAESYLVIEKIVEACKKTGAEAVHPGYGFLSEREAFPRALEAAGIVFIGAYARAPRCPKTSVRP